MSKPRFAIAAGSPVTIDVGKTIGDMGGNTVDVAVGAGLTAMFAEVLMCSLGGSAFAMIKPAGGQAELIDGADAMPKNCEGSRVKDVHLEYGDGITVHVGHGTVAVPGALRALEMAWKRHGKLPWKELLAPVIEASQKPAPAGQTLAAWLSIAGEKVFYPNETSRACFFKNEQIDQVLRAEDHFTLPYMAETLKIIEEQGADGLYRGDLSAQFETEMLNHGGLVRRSDLAAYEAVIRKPIVLQSGDYHIAVNPAPAVGGIAVGSLLNLFDTHFNQGMTGPERGRLVADVQSALIRLKSSPEWHPPFAPGEDEKFLEKDHLEKWWQKIRSANTMQISVAGTDGSAVSITMSNGYGSGITIPKTGIVCNNSLGEPELNPHGYYKLPAGSRLISNMAPVVGWSDARGVIALGSPGASRITTSIFQTWLQYVYLKKSIEESVAAPRLHIEEMDGNLRAQLEAGYPSEELTPAYELREFELHDMYFGAIKAATCCPGGELHAVADPRRQGATRLF